MENQLQSDESPAPTFAAADLTLVERKVDQVRTRLRLQAALRGLILGLLARSRSNRAAPIDTGEGQSRPWLPLLTLLATPVAAVTLYAVQRSLHVDGIAPIHFYNAGGTLAVGAIAWAVYAVTRSPHPPAPSS